MNSAKYMYQHVSKIKYWSQTLKRTFFTDVIHDSLYSNQSLHVNSISNPNVGNVTFTDPLSLEINQTN